MNSTAFFFYFFSALLVFAGFRVVTARNPVYAVLYLVLAFFNAAGIWMLLHAEFLAIILVLVYVGAVMVLFLFVVMMLDINIDALRRDFWKYFPVGALIALVIVVEAGFVLLGGFPEPLAGAPASATSNTAELGKLLYTQYLYPFEIAAVLLLLAMISAIALTLRHRKDSLAIDPAQQIKAKKSERLRVLKMAPVVPVEPVPDAAPQEDHKEGDKA